MQKLKCIIVDDEEADLKLIKKITEDIQQIEIVGEYRNPIIALQNLESVDLVLLDITFDGYNTNGIEFISYMSHSAKVIIISGKASHAFDAFQFRRDIVFGYLLKPIDPIKLIRIIDEVHRATFGGNTTGESNIPPVTSVRKSFPIRTSEKKDNTTIERIFLFEEILYFKGDKDYKEIHTKDKMYLTSESFIDLLKRLPKDLFMETHRSYIVNITNIDTIEGNEIFFRDTGREKKRAKTTIGNKEILLKKLGN